MFDMNTLSYAYGKPQVSARFKAYEEDFKVDEILGFTLSGLGEHQFLRIEKRGLNTEELVKRVARALDKSIKQISYAGLKDRHAVTTQWLSVHCPGETIANVNELLGDGWRVIESGRHLKKLKVGGLIGNQFTLTLRDITDFDAIETRLTSIQATGVPNYFGPQRFGHNGQNVVKAMDMLIHGGRVGDRFLRGMYYSAARSFLFNHILSARVANQTWNQAVSGDVMQLSGSRSLFSIEDPDDIIHSRVQHQDISPASALWGAGEVRERKDALAIQENALQEFGSVCLALGNQGLERSYRAHVLCPEHLAWQRHDPHMVLSFELPAGAYATSVLRELIDID